MMCPGTWDGRGSTTVLERLFELLPKRTTRDTKYNLFRGLKKYYSRHLSVQELWHDIDFNKRIVSLLLRGTFANGCYCAHIFCSGFNTQSHVSWSCEPLKKPPFYVMLRHVTLSYVGLHY